MGEIKCLRQFSRNFVSPAEQVGKQIDGIAGCRACGGSAGILSGSGGGAITCKGCAQAVSSSASVIGIAARSVNAVLAILGLLVESGLPLGFGSAECYDCRCGLVADVGQHHGVVGVHGLSRRR
ncbi:MAG: hypothetical protein BGO66_13230 [Alicycliphilus sp. 69-12]|nr:MAG: hypothetical protein BGO66_13230 [Alicycliphilus sp. 69-12]